MKRILGQFVKRNPPGPHTQPWLLGIVLVCLWILLFARFGSSAEDGPRVQRVTGTVHNLSAFGPGATRAVNMEEVCKFCHVSHKASPVGLLFNKADTEASFVPYTSPSLDATVGAPTSLSRLCLTCHDGTIALGDLLSEPSIVPFPVGRENLDPTIGGLEPMLRDDHPVSFIYDLQLATDDGQLNSPLSLPPDMLLEDGNVLQCSTCHDAHDNTNGYFLRTGWENGALCKTCHTMNGWPMAAHQAAARANAFKPAGEEGSLAAAEAVTATECLACHDVHFSTLDTPLLDGPGEEQGCYTCHGSSGPGADVQSDFSQTYTHPVDLTSGVHAVGEDPVSMNRHVECLDCHNPHAAFSSGDPIDTMNEMPGIDTFGSPVFPATAPQEVCYRCHGLAPPATPAASRQVSGYSVREQFSPTAASSHPVDSDAGGSIPSLLPAWQGVTRITCTDCHGGSEGGAGESRPHGSPNPYLTRAFYNIGDNGSYNDGDAALCAKCHSIGIVRSDNSNFDKHDKHMKEGAFCGTCHTAHGVPGSPSNNAHLINFNLNDVSPLQSGRLEYVSLGPRQGECYLSCHGKKHDPKSYN